MSRKLRPILFSAGVVTVLASIALPASASSMGSGTFFVQAENDADSSIQARVGSAGKSSDTGGPTDPETPELDTTVISTFTCDGYSFNITQGMVDWSERNKASHAAGNDAAVKPYPDGGWNYMLSAEELGGFLPGGEWGPAVEAFAFSKEAIPGTEGTWDALGFSTKGFHNTKGIAFAATVDYGSGTTTCSYAKAQNGLGQGDSPTDPALFSKSASDSKAIYMAGGKLVSSEENPAAITTNVTGKTTAWAKPGIDWNRDVVGPDAHPQNGKEFDWGLLDRDSNPGKIHEESDGSSYEFFPVLTRSNTDYFVDRFVYRADGTLNEYSSEHVSRNSGSQYTQVKPSSKIDGPALVRYAEDGITPTEAHYFWEGGGSATDQDSYERAGGTGWIGYWPS